MKSALRADWFESGLRAFPGLRFQPPGIPVSGLFFKAHSLKRVPGRYFFNTLQRRIIALSIRILCFVLCLIALYTLAGGEQKVRYRLITWPKHRLRGVNINLDHNPPTRADLEHLAKDWKANHVRLQIFTAGVPEEAGEPEKPMPDYFPKKVDPVLRWCQELGLTVTLDSHGAPGNPRDWSQRPLWQDFRWHENFARLWGQIARYYRDNAAIVAYELLNEPNMSQQVPETPSDWNALAKRLTKAIREADRRHTLITGPADWSNPQGFASLKPTGDPNTLYTFHMYLPHRFTHQGVFPQNPAGVVYPGRVDGQMWDKEALRRAMQPAVDFQKKYNLPRLYVGEFSAIVWAPGDSAYRYLRDAISLFEEQGWDWAYHAYREWTGWSLEHEGADREHLHPVGDTARLDLIKGYFARNRKAGVSR